MKTIWKSLAQRKWPTYLAQVRPEKKASKTEINNSINYQQDWNVTGHKKNKPHKVEYAEMQKSRQNNWNVLENLLYQWLFVTICGVPFTSGSVTYGNLMYCIGPCKQRRKCTEVITSYNSQQNGMLNTKTTNKFTEKVASYDVPYITRTQVNRTSHQCRKAKEHDTLTVTIMNNATSTAAN